MPTLNPQSLAAPDRDLLARFFALGEDLHALAKRTGRDYIDLLAWFASPPIQALLKAHRTALRCAADHRRRAAQQPPAAPNEPPPAKPSRSPVAHLLHSLNMHSAAPHALFSPGAWIAHAAAETPPDPAPALQSLTHRRTPALNLLRRAGTLSSGP